MTIEPQTPRILFLTSWYPHKHDQMVGLFVKNHAEAIEPFTQVAVLQVVLHPAVEQYAIEETTENGIFTCRVYIPQSHIPLLAKLFNAFHYLKAWKTGWQLIKEKWGTPNLCHAHVLTRNVWFANQLKKRLKIPYIISEHWSRYLPQNSQSYRGIIRKYYTRKFVKEAAAVLPVSNLLHEAMLKNQLFNPSYQVVPNVMNTARFTIKPASQAIEQTTFLSVTCFDEKSKNLKLLLDAFDELQKQTLPVRLILAGDGPDKALIQEYVQQKNLGSLVTFTGELLGDEMVKAYHQADALVLSSNYETFGMVIPEALLCGLPVIATRVGIAPEIISPALGLLVDTNNITQLKNAMLQFHQTKTTYKAELIRQNVLQLHRFGMDDVGKQLSDIYTNVLQG